jgi:hypothetical protein
MAIGGMAVGGGAIGHYALGGSTSGVHALGGNVRDSQAIEFLPPLLRSVAGNLLRR